MTDWPVKPLSEVCDFVSGSVTPKLGVNYQVFSVPSFDYGNPELLDGSKIKSSKRPVEPGDVLLCKINPRINRVWRVDRESKNQQIASTEWIALRCRENILATFLQYVLQAPSARTAMIESVTGATGSHTRAKFEIVEELEFSVPPLEEQKRIVALLDEATARVTELTSCYEQARTHANNMHTSALRDALEGSPDWPVKTIGDVCELVSRGRPPSYCEVGGIVVLNQKCVRNGKIDFGPSRLTDNSVKAIPEWAYLCEGDTLINSTGAGTLGRASFISKLTELTTFDTHLTVVRPRRDLCWPAFVGLVLNGREKDIVDLAGGATGQTELPRESVRSFEIPVPPLEEQKQIVARLNLIRAKTLEMVAAYDVKLQAAKDLRQSILESAFAGDL